MIYTVTRTFDTGRTPLINQIEHPNKAKAISTANKTALLIAQHADIKGAGLLTLTNAKGATVGTWFLEPNTVDIYGKWRSGYGMQQSN